MVFVDETDGDLKPLMINAYVCKYIIPEPTVLRLRG